MSRLTIVQAARKRVLQYAPTLVSSESSDTAVIALGELANQSGIDLVRRHEWTFLQKEQTFTALAQEVQTSMIPADFDRFIDETWFNRSKTRRILGPLTPVEWQRRKTLQASPVFESFRVRGSDVLMIPNPEAGDTLVFEYISKNWVDTNADGAGEASTFSADTDTPLFDEELMTLDITWRYLSAQGMDYSEPFRSFELALADRIARDGGNETISLTGDMGSSPRVPHIPEGSWNL